MLEISELISSVNQDRFYINPNRPGLSVLLADLEKCYPSGHLNIEPKILLWNVVNWVKQMLPCLRTKDIILAWLNILLFFLLFVANMITMLVILMTLQKWNLVSKTAFWDRFAILNLCLADDMPSGQYLWNFLKDQPLDKVHSVLLNNFLSLATGVRIPDRVNDSIPYLCVSIFPSWSRLNICYSYLLWSCAHIRAVVVCPHIQVVK